MDTYWALSLEELSGMASGSTPLYQEPEITRYVLRLSRPRWAQHLARMEEHEFAKKISHGTKKKNPPRARTRGPFSEFATGTQRHRIANRANADSSVGSKYLLHTKCSVIIPLTVQLFN